MNPSFGVFADISLVVDATNADDIDTSIDEFENLFDDQWIVELNPVFITSSPTEIPSAPPSKLPTTLQPSPKPSITGLVITIDVPFSFRYILLLVFEVTSTVSSELSEVEIEEMTATIVEEFDVSNDKVTTEFDYVTSGVLEISVDAKISEDEVAEAVISSFAELLDIHPSDFTIISIDLESGEVLYQVSSPNYSDATQIQSSMETLQPHDVESEIQNLIPTMEVESVDVNDSVDVHVSIIVDGSEAGSIGEAKLNVTQIFNDQGFEVVTNVAIVTSAPSISPTFTTMIPSSAPSITGIIVTLTLATSNEILNSTEVNQLESKLAEDYGVNVEDVTIEVDYIVSGLVDFDDLPDDVSDSEVEAIMQEIIANTLGAHSSDIHVAFDSSTGELTYAVTSDDDNIANGIQQVLDSSTFEEELMTEITTFLPSVTVTSMSIEDEIEMNAVVTIDATESTIDIEKANQEIVSEFEDQGFSIDAESNDVNNS